MYIRVSINWGHKSPNSFVLTSEIVNGYGSSAGTVEVDLGGDLEA